MNPSCVTTQDAPSGQPEPSCVRPIGSLDLLRNGDVLAGVFEIRGKLGEGGMGQVYEAHDHVLGRRVAIKAARPENREALHKEARALAQLRHPGVVAVHGLGEHGQIPYAVLERIPGSSLQSQLESRLRDGSWLGVEETIDILAAMADVLATVHRAGMAHRDVKPANVMIAPGPRVVLTDFGIFQPEIEVNGHLHNAGSPHYIAPETITMRTEPGALFLVDVYSLGVVAFQLLTGEVPYDDPNVMKILWMHGHAPVPDVVPVRGLVPRGLADLVHEMLAKDPQERPQSMESIAWRLRRMGHIALLGRGESWYRTCTEP